MTRDYVRQANREGTHITLEMVAERLAKEAPEQQFSLRHWVVRWIDGALHSGRERAPNISRKKIRLSLRVNAISAKSVPIARETR